MDSVSAVDLWLSLIILPDYAELDDALGNRDNLEGCLVFRVCLEKGTVLQSGDKLYEKKSISCCDSLFMM